MDDKTPSRMKAYAAMKLQEVESEGLRLGRNSVIVGRDDIKPTDYPLNRKCPCGSGRKYKRCGKVGKCKN